MLAGRCVEPWISQKWTPYTCEKIVRILYAFRQNSTDNTLNRKWHTNSFFLFLLLLFLIFCTNEIFAQMFQNRIRLSWYIGTSLLLNLTVESSSSFKFNNEHKVYFQNTASIEFSPLDEGAWIVSICLWNWSLIIVRRLCIFIDFFFIFYLFWTSVHDVHQFVRVSIRFCEMYDSTKLQVKKRTKPDISLWYVLTRPCRCQVLTLHFQKRVVTCVRAMSNTITMKWKRQLICGAHNFHISK